MELLLSLLNGLAEQLDVDLLLKIVLGLIMLGVGFSLKVKDFYYVGKNKSLLLIGLVIKLLLLPIISFLLVEQTNLSSVFKFGIIILMISPGGTTTNVITYWFGGTSILTIFLTSISSLICIVSIPAFVNFFSLHYFGEASVFKLPIQETVANILLIIILPSLVGLFISEKFETIAKQLEKILKPVSVGLLGAVFIIKFFASSSAGGAEITWQELKDLLPCLLLINVLSMFISFYIPKFFGKNNQDSMTIGIEAGIQNAALAILIGGVFLSNQELIKPALVYAMFSFWTTVIFAFIIRKKYYEKDWT